jgi:hypothetical protein
MLPMAWKTKRRARMPNPVRRDLNSGAHGPLCPWARTLIPVMVGLGPTTHDFANARTAGPMKPHPQ